MNNLQSEPRDTRINMNKLQSILSMLDICSLSIVTFYTCLAVIFIGQVPNALSNIFLNVILGVSVVAFAVLEDNHGWLLFTIMRRFYPIGFTFLMYDQVQSYIPAFHGSRLYDDWLISADAAILGVNPTQYLEKIINPFLTEFLQLCYFLFYLMPVVHGTELFLQKRHAEMKNLIFVVVFGFYWSYVMYLFLPAIGPRFSLHDFQAIDAELPGIFLAETFRHIINAGSKIIPNHPHPELLVNRDCFPSGHTWMTILNIYLSFQTKSRLRWGFVLFGSGLIFSTVYLRYHYVVDVLGGVFFAALTLWIAPKLWKMCEKYGFTNL